MIDLVVKMWALTLTSLFTWTAIRVGGQASDSQLAQHYEKLIEENIAMAKNFTKPKRNEEFQSCGTEIQDYGAYDFIIVGAGSAGSVLATRLTEISDWAVLLLEAGGEETEFSEIPFMMAYIQSSRLNWGYFTTPQKHACLGMNKNQCGYARGKALGGSSSINYMYYSRGHKRDYDEWVKLGNPGWSYEEVHPYFRKSENSEVDGDPGYHGVGGPLNVAYPAPPLETFSSFREACEEVELEELDYNGQKEFGFSLVQATIKNGRRQSTANTFLSIARERSNLNITTEALVTKILFDDEEKAATGVLFTKGNAKFKATAKKEVIVSGGALNSPQLLMLSGIGPKDDLEKLGIKVVKDLPVGRNLQEHPFFASMNFRTNTTANLSSLKDDINRYLKGTGPLTVPLSMDDIAFPKALADSDGTPLFELIYAPFRGNLNCKQFEDSLNFRDDVKKSIIEEVNISSDFAIYFILLHPRSRGSVTLKSSDPLDFPDIDTNHLSSDEDMEAMYRAAQYVLNLTKTEAFRKLDATFLGFGEVCKEHQELSKEFWFCIFRQLTSVMHHGLGTTQMGPDEGKAVVDHELKLHGLQKLRVVDAGVMPLMPSGHTNAPVIMIAEKISDVIKKEYGKQL